MDLHLKGKTAVITGGGTGIGKATALEFAKEGVHIAVCGRRCEPLEEMEKIFRDKQYDFYSEQCDVSDHNAMEEFAWNVYQKYGSIDIWVNNAGIAIDKALLDYTDEDWDQVMSIDLRAVFDCTRLAAFYMRKGRKGGVILNASSYASLIPHANGAIYAAAKSAVSSLTKTSAANLAPYGIRVIGYVPGMINTGISKESIAKFGQDLVKNISLQRLGNPEDLAKPLVFLTSDAARYITGTDIEITGGKFAVQDCSLGWSMAEDQAK